MLIPPELMGAHIGPTRSHTTGRVHSLAFRAVTALFGHLGVEWNVLTLDDRERAQLAEVIALHQRFRPLLHSGDTVRFDPVRNGQEPASQAYGVYSADRSEALVAHVQLTTGMSLLPPPLRLPGLVPDRRYVRRARPVARGDVGMAAERHRAHRRPVGGARRAAAAPAPRERHPPPPHRCLTRTAARRMAGVSDRISAADVAKVAQLARLDVTAEEIERMTVQLDGMLEHFADIDALDLAAVDPMTQPYPLVNVLRPDVVRPASTATKCSPPRPPPRTAASVCRRSSGSTLMGIATDIAAARSRRAPPRPPISSSSISPRIAEREPEIHAFNLVMADEARAARRRRSTRTVAAGNDPGPLAGVTVALKDNMCTRGVPTTCSSKILEGWKPPYDATVVRHAAAPPAPSPSARPTSTSSPWAPAPRTPPSAPPGTRTTLSRVPGGSSGGSAAAVAAGFSHVALGSDTGGSIRQPAALCGVVGVKPTYGYVSRYGLVAFASSLDQIGPFTSTVADAALVLDVIGGHDPLDSTSIPQQHPSLTDGDRAGRGRPARRAHHRPARGRRPRCAGAARSRLRRARRPRAPPSSTSQVPAFTFGLTAYYLIAPAEASSNLARYDGVRYGLRVEAADTNAMYGATRAAGFGDEVKRRIMLGTYALSAGYYDAYYGKALKVRRLIHDDFERAYQQADVLLTPTSPTVAFQFGAKGDNPFAMYLCDTYTIPTNLAGHPGMSVPFGTGAARPAGGCAGARRHPAGADHVPRRRSTGTRSAGEVSEYDGLPGDWELVVGLEVHVELATDDQAVLAPAPTASATSRTPTSTRSRSACPARCRCSTSRRSSWPCASALALNCTIQPCTFHRKNYFYPDMPKAYQISQYDQPLNVDGYLDLPDGMRVGIERAHMEEDAGKSTHVGGSGGRVHGATHSLIDLNRAGVPLVEIVSRPDIRSAEEARQYVNELRSILVAIGASDAKMEEGCMRVDANVSVHKPGTPLGTRCEIKNVNSVRSRRPRHRVRGPSPDRPARERRHGPPGDPSLGRERRPHAHAAQQGRRRRLPLLPRARPRAAGAVGEWIHRVHASLPLLPAQRRAHLADRHRAGRRQRGGHERGRARPGRLRARGRRTSAATSARALVYVKEAFADQGTDPAVPAARSRGAHHAWRSSGKVTATQAKAVLAETASPTAAATRRPSPRPRASRRSTPAPLEAAGRPGHRRPTPMRGRSSAPATARRWVPSSAWS